MNHGRVSPDRQIDEEKLEQQTKNSLFKNLNEIAKQAGILEVKIVKLIEDLKKDKALNDKHEKIVLPNIIDEKIEFLTKNVKEILKNKEARKINLIKEISRSLAIGQNSDVRTPCSYC
ncbi:unnamed protein product [Meloidogyne enterolobii]|uniref:Uncharacterized protein n=1 Tax=Meloidogyne enterolobii TaxID=390850 RepID=A0ACB1B830_MELEN